ncbi:MAG: GAF domain-containing protein [Chloroflexia bacterium]|nr:GAF domain-containing protein [Chloroflexia bacterium]
MTRSIGAASVLLLEAGPVTDPGTVVLAHHGEDISTVSSRVRAIILRDLARPDADGIVRHVSAEVVIVAVRPTGMPWRTTATRTDRFLVAIGPFRGIPGSTVVAQLKRASAIVSSLPAPGRNAADVTRPSLGPSPVSIPPGAPGAPVAPAVPVQAGRRQLSVIGTVTRALTRIDAAEDLLPVLARETATALDADRVGIFVYAGASARISSYHWFGTTGDVSADQPSAFIDVTTSPRDHPDERRMIEVPRVYANDEIVRTSTPGQAQSRALAPLPGHGEVLGCVWVIRDRHDPFTAEEIGLLEVIGHLGAYAVSRSRLVEDERRQRRLADALREVAVRLQESQDLEGLLTKVAAVVGAAVGVNRVSIHAYDGTHQSSIAAGYFGYPYVPGLKDAVRTLPPAEVPAEAEVMRTRQTLVRGISSPFKSPFTVATRRSDIVVPLIADHDVEGVMYVWEDDVDHPFSVDDIYLLETIGRQVGQAFVRMRDRERAIRRADHLQLLNQVGRALAGSRDVDNLCQMIYAEVSRVLTTDAFLIALYQDGRDTVDLRYMVDNGRVYPPETRPIEASPIATMLGDHASHVYQRSEAGSPSEAHRFGSTETHVQAALFVPMVHDGRLIGIVSVQRYDDARYDGDDLSTLETIAQQAASALAIAGLHEETVTARRAAEGRAKDLETILAVSQALAEAQDVPTVLDHLSIALASLVPHDDLVVVQHHDERTWLPIHHVRGRGSDTQVLTTTPLWWGDKVFGEAWSPAQVARASDVSTGFLAMEDRRWGQVIATPMVAGGVEPEIALLARWDATPWSDPEVTAIQLLMGRAAAAVANIRFLAESHRAEARIARHAANLEAVLDTTLSVTAELDLDDTLNTLADYVARLIPHESLVMLRIDSHTGDLVTLLGRQPSAGTDLADLLSRNRHLIERIAAEGSGSLINDAHLLMAGLRAPSSGEPVESADLEQSMHLVGAPLRAGGQSIGAIILGRTGTFRFGLADLDVFRILAAQAGVALQTSLLIEVERRRRRQAAAMVEIVASLNRSVTLTEIVERLAPRITAAVGVDRAALWLYDESLDRTIIAVRYFGDRGGELIHDAYPHAPDPSSPSQFPVEHELLRTGEVLHGDRLECLFGTRRHEHWAGQRSGVVIPLTIRGHTRGAIYVYSSTDDDPGRPRYDFTGDEIELLTAISGQASGAIERAALYDRTERRVQELRVLSDVTSASAQNLEVRPIAEAALRSLATAIPFTLGGLVDHQTGLAASQAITVHDATHRPTSCPGLVAWLESIRPAIDAQDVVTCSIVPGTLPDAVPGGSMLVVALRIDDHLAASLVLSREPGHDFSPDEVALAALVARQLALGFERVHTHRMAIEARDRSERQAFHVSTVLATTRRLTLQDRIIDVSTGVADGVQAIIADSECTVWRQDDVAGSPVLQRVIDTAPVRSSPERSALHTLVVRAIELGDVAHGSIGIEPGDDYGAVRRTAVAVPMVSENTVVGGVTVDVAEGRVFTADDLTTLQLYAMHTAAIIRGGELLTRNRELYLAGVRALASAVDAKDPYTRGHSERVSKHSRRIAIALGLEKEDIERIELAALLHDIGKIGVPDAILQKPGSLDDAERAVMMSHSSLGANILRDARSAELQPLVPLIRHHHEWANGSGYPDRLHEHQIPIGAAIIAVADAFDTMATDRPYRQRRPEAEAIVELIRCKGTQFRADIVDVFIRLLPKDTSYLVPSVEAPAPSVWDGSRVILPPAGISPPGQLGDTRALALLVELAGVTGTIADLPTLLKEITSLIQRHMQYDELMLMLTDPKGTDLVMASHASSQGSSSLVGFRVPAGVGICSDVIRTGELRNVPDVSKDSMYFTDWDDWGGSELVIPLAVEGRRIGVINVESARLAAFTGADEAVLTAIAGQVAAAIHVAQLHDEAKRAASTDGLTGVLNHRAFYEALEWAIETHDAVTVIIFDVEGLKAVNDSAGHLAGDALLRLVARTIADNVRAGDSVARYGGDEFGVVMANTTDDDAAWIAERIRAFLSARRDAVLGATGPLASVRYGIATGSRQSSTPSELVGIADGRLYAMRDRLGSGEQMATTERRSPAQALDYPFLDPRKVVIQSGPISRG